jgi:hypothetical protein
MKGMQKRVKGLQQEYQHLLYHQHHSSSSKSNTIPSMTMTTEPAIIAVMMMILLLLVLLKNLPMYKSLWQTNANKCNIVTNQRNKNINVAIKLKTFKNKMYLEENSVLNKAA